jgi:hypothetical protein
VSFQSISCRGNLGLDDDESNTYAADVPGPCSAWSIWAWSLTRSSPIPPSLALMGSTLMTCGEVDVPTSPRTPPTPASSARGGVAVLESLAGGGVGPFHRQLMVGSPFSHHQPATAPRPLGRATSCGRVKLERPGRAEAPQLTYIVHHTHASIRSMTTIS